MPGPYTWKEFKDEVKLLTPVDALRATTSTAASDYYERVLRHGVIQLQHHVPAYTIGQEALYGPSDFATEGSASRGVLPPEATIRDIYLIRINETNEDGEDTVNRYATDRFPYSRRFELVHAEYPLNDQVPKVAIDPQGYTFYVYPAVVDPYAVSVFFDGRRIEYKDHDVTALDEPAVKAVADYVRAMHARDVEKDKTAAKAYMADFEKQKTFLHVDKKGITK